MNGFTVRACKAFLIMGVTLTLLGGLGMAGLAARRHSSHDMTLGEAILGLVVMGGMFAYCLGGLTRVDERGISTSRLGIRRTRRFYPWDEICGVAVLDSSAARSSRAVKVALKDGSVHELLAPIPTSGGIIRAPDRQFDAAAQEIIEYCHTAAPSSSTVTAEEIAQMSLAYAKAHSKRTR